VERPTGEVSSDRAMAAKPTSAAPRRPPATEFLRGLKLAREHAKHSTLHALTTKPANPDLAEKLWAFERSIVLHLTTGEAYNRIHPIDFNALYRNVGDTAVTLVLEQRDRVIATSTIVAKRMAIPGRRPIRFSYSLNLRIAPQHRYGAVLNRLEVAGTWWSIRHRCTPMLACVPNATSTLPRSRSGRFVIPSLEHAAQCSRLFIPLDRADTSDLADRCITDERRVRALFRRHNRRRVHPLGGDPAARSSVPPVWLALPDDSACCCVEDPHAHMTYRGVNQPDAFWRCGSFLGADTFDNLLRIVRVACAHATRVGDEPLMLMTDDRTAERLLDHLGRPMEPVPLAMYAHTRRPLPKGDGPAPGAAWGEWGGWAFNVSEI